MKKLLLFLNLLLLACSSLFATDRHVTTTAGTSIQDKINEAVSGDQVIIHAGTYNQSIQVFNKTNLTITYANDGVVTIQGNGTTDETIYIQNPNNVTISNLTIKNTKKAIFVKGILVEGFGNGLNILNNIITDVSYKSGAFNASDDPGQGNFNNSSGPLLVAATSMTSVLSNVVISGNQVFNCMTGWSEALALKGNVDGFTISDNIVHDVTNIGIDAYGLGGYPNAAQPRNGLISNNTVYNAVCNYTDNGGIYVDGGKDIVVSNNKVYGGLFGITIGCENQGEVPGGATSGIKVLNNLVYNNSRAGLVIGTSGDDNGIQGDVTTTIISGNTFLKNSTNQKNPVAQFPSQQELTLQNCNQIQIYNNIFQGLNQRMVEEGPGKGTCTIGYNIFYNPVGSPNISQQATGWLEINFATWKGQNSDATSSFINPLLVNASQTTPDAHLQSSSPAINAGQPGYTPVSGEVDIDGQTRVQNSRIDIGVDESGTGGTVSVTGVSVSPTSASIAVSGTQQLTRTISPSNATNQTVTWTSSNTAIATVNSNGLVTGVAAGSATITVTTQDGNFTANSSITVTGGGLPSPWATSNVGSVGQTGSASHSGGTFTVAGSGADIWGTADAFRYVYQQVTGDATITARVASLGNTDPWAKAGVMMRTSLNANSQHALTAVTVSNGLAFQRRVSTGGTSTHTAGSAGAAPYWVRMQRVGNVFSSFVSTNGTSWTPVGTETIAMGATVYVGLAVTAHNNTTTSTATFDNVSLTTGGTVPSAPSGLSATAASSSQINLSWTDNSNNETGFKIERKTGAGGTYAEITTTAAGVTTYNNTGLSASTAYYYRVRATNATGNSSYSNEANATTQASTIAVTGVSVSPTSASIAVNGTQQLTRTISPSNASNQTVTWSSSNTAIATVNSSGLVTGVAAGSATITVTTQDGNFTANSSITVTSGGGGTNITIDGSLSDWSGVTAIATASGQSSLSLKVYDDGTYLYFGVSGSGFGTHYQIMLNTDNNTSTGFNHSLFTGNQGIDYHIEDGNLKRYTGTTNWWDDAIIGTATQYMSGTTVREVRIAKSLFTSLNSTIQVGFVDINSGWTAVSKLGFASFAVQSGGGTTITIDGSLSDWSGISAIATATGQSTLSLKVYDDATYLYFAVSGSGLGVNYQLHLNTDNNTATGFDIDSYAGTDGLDYHIQNGDIKRYTGTTNWWDDAVIGTATQSVSGTTVREIRITKSLLTGMGSTIKVGFADIDGSWQISSSLGLSTYTLVNSGSRMISAVDDEILAEPIIKVYPNPVVEKLFINLGKCVDAKITIRDLSGKELYIKENQSGELLILRNEIQAKGVMLMEIQSGSERYFQKIIIH